MNYSMVTIFFLTDHNKLHINTSWHGISNQLGYPATYGQHGIWHHMHQCVIGMRCQAPGLRVLP